MLICRKCLQVPYIEFLPGLMVRFSCHEKNLINHTDLDRTIIDQFTLKCSCGKESENFHFLIAKIICDKCLNKYQDFMKKNEKYINNNQLLNKCINHFKKYSFYNIKNKLLFCEYCNIPNDSKPLNEFDNEFKINIIDKLNDFKVFPKNYELLINKIIQTYKNYGKTQKFNIYYNLSNLVNFLTDYSTLAPFCQKCKEIYFFNNLDEINNDSAEKESNFNLEVSCKCSKLNFNSIQEFENKINSNICENCNKNFNQIDLIFDEIKEKFLCKDCCEKTGSFDYVCFNEFIYFCWYHLKNYEFYCLKCGKFFCNDCKILDNHTIIKLKKNDNKNYSLVLNEKNWFIKLKKEGLLNLKFEKKEECKINNIEQHLNNLITTAEKENNFFENRNNLEKNLKTINKIINNIRDFTFKENISDKIIKLQNENNKLRLSIYTILNQLREKNELTHLIYIRNVFQHLIINIIKKNYSFFELIKEDFRILYESYFYLNYDFINENNKNIKKIIEKKLNVIIRKFINFIKNFIKKKEIQKFINRLITINKEKKLNLNNNEIKQMETSKDIKQCFDNIINKTLPKISENNKIKIFNETFENEIKNNIDTEKFTVIKEYNNFLFNQNIINNKKKFNDIKNLIENLEKNEIPEDIEKKGFMKFVKITGNLYNEKYGYVNENSINDDLIKEFFKNSQENENFQYLLLKEDNKEFLNSINCKSDFEFYFLYILITNIIKRIGKIIHQNDDQFKLLFKDNKSDLNIEKLLLIKDENEKEGFKFIEKKNENDFKTIKLTNSIPNLNDLDNFSNDFYNFHIKKLENLLEEQKLKKLKNKIENEFNFIPTNDFLDNLKKIFDVQKEQILFYYNYKDLFILFPSIKEILSFNIEYDVKNPIENIFFNISNKNQEFSIANYFIKNYLLIIYTRNVIKNVEDEYNNQSIKSEKILENYIKSEIKNIILECYKKKINEYKIVDVFEQEKNKLINIFTKMKKNLSKNEEKISKKNEDFNKLKKQEIEKYESVINEMKNINFEIIDNKFQEYLKDINTDLYAYSKFDVILFLLQNNFIDEQT